MIYNVNLGQKTESDKTLWEPVFNQFGSFIEREDINQMIKIPHLDDRDTFNLTELGNGQILPVNSKWVNNGKNMSPALINIRKDEVGKIDESLVYITLNENSLKLLKFKAHQDVLNTYHGNDYVGCAVVVNNTKLDPNEPIMEIWAKDVESKRYKYITVLLNDKENQCAYVEVDAAGGEVRELKKLDTARRRRFKIVSNKLLTSVFFVSNEKDEKKIKELTKNMKYVQIYNIGGDSDEKLEMRCKNLLLGNKVKAFTLVNDASIPFDIWNKCRILFVMKYSTDKKEQICLKSN